jgi:hypothetical protein
MWEAVAVVVIDYIFVVENWLMSKVRTAVAEARGHFGNLEEGEYSLLKSCY